MPLTWIAVLCLLAAACSGTAAPPPASGDAERRQDLTLFEGARLIDGETGRAIEDAAFLVVGERITRVGRRGEVDAPAGAARVDLTGKTVIPALVSTHVHVGLLDGADFGTHLYTRETIIGHLRRYAQHGLGAVLSAGTDVGTLSFDIRREQPEGAARLLTSGRGMASPDGGPGFPAIAKTSFPITSVEEGRARVAELAAAGANAVKIWVDDRGGKVKKLTRELYEPIIDEAHKRLMIAVAHVYYLQDARDLVEAGIDGFMHPVRDAVMDDKLIARMKERQVFVAANIGLSHRATLTELPASSVNLLLRSVPADVVNAYQASLRSRSPEALARARETYERVAANVAKLNAAGVTIVLGADTGIPNAWHGWAEHYELETMVAAGMTPAQVIVAATSAAARVLKLDDMGNVAPGKRADFVVLDANPLENISNVSRITEVYLRGRAVKPDTSR
jgi:imidazolonepropionase-like amidohydrolase